MCSTGDAQTNAECLAMFDNYWEWLTRLTKPGGALLIEVLNLSPLPGLTAAKEAANAAPI